MNRNHFFTTVCALVFALITLSVAVPVACSAHRAAEAIHARQAAGEQLWEGK